MKIIKQQHFFRINLLSLKSNIPIIMTAHTQTPYIAYYRVSTKKQGKSGLSLEHQRDSAHQFIESRNGLLLSEYTEVETGTRKKKRVQIMNALAECKQIGATLLIATLDRLTRDAEFFFSLQNAKVKFQCIDMPEANETVLGIMAVLAQDEAKRIKVRCNKAVETRRKRIAIENKKRKEENVIRIMNGEEPLPMLKMGFDDSTEEKKLEIKTSRQIGLLHSIQSRQEVARQNNSVAAEYVCSNRNRYNKITKDGKTTFRPPTFNEIAEGMNRAGMRKQNSSPWDAKAVQLLYLRYCVNPNGGKKVVVDELD